MLIHITPQLLCQPMERFSDCVLVDVQVPEIGLHLQKGKDLVTRTPYPNKTILVGSRNIGRKAVAGILIKVPIRMREYTAVSRWSINAEIVVTHRVSYTVLDDEFDMVSDNMLLWGSQPPRHGG